MAKKGPDQVGRQIGARTILDAFAHGYGAALDFTGSLFLSHPGRFFQQSPAGAYRRATRQDWSRAIERATSRNQVND